METAIPTKPIVHIFRKLTEVRSDEEKAIAQDSYVAGLATDDRWKAYKRVVEQRIDALRSLEGMIDSSDTPETVGFRYLAVSVAIAHLKELISLPDVLFEAQQNNERGKTDSK